MPGRGFMAPPGETGPAGPGDPSSLRSLGMTAGEMEDSSADYPALRAVTIVVVLERIIAM